MHARERRNVSDIASLVDIYGKVSTVTQAVSPLPPKMKENLAVRMR